MTRMHVLTVRLDGHLYARLEAFALAEGRPMAQIIREAVERYILARSGEPAFQERLRELIGYWESMLLPVAPNSMDAIV